MTKGANPWRRRAIVAGGTLAVAAWVVGIPRLASLWPAQLHYTDIAGLAPFRELTTAGTLSTVSGLLTGLDGPASADPAQQARIAGVRADPCNALFVPLGDTRLPIAFFSDFNCPNCRVLEAILIRYDAENPGTIRIIHHELPLLGADSVTASKAVLAADRQGGYTVMRDRLLRARLVTDANLMMAMANSVGLNGVRLVADMQSPALEAALDHSRAIAAVFGFYGTPSTVIGHTVFLGALAEVDVRQIIAEELAASPACAAAD